LNWIQISSNPVPQEVTDPAVNRTTVQMDREAQPLEQLKPDSGSWLP
jgi:hypothetical protein